ncbi:uncharacterized protein VTP21DRAFT_3406 [Calcarisporiella thermophila]|uniref:uncharacterized protein n=1 Tax=Calcarisporiella thermophila TaxID=911321 RepID=UPI0037435655
MEQYILSHLIPTPPASPSRILEPHQRRKVLVCWDNSPSSSYMFDWALGNILHSEIDHVILASVLDVQESTFLTIHIGKESAKGLHGHSRRLSFKEREQTNELLRPLVERLNKNGITAQVVVLKGDAKDKLVELSKEVKADLCIVGSRGLNTIQRKLIGSVSHALVNKCECPVVVVKPKERTQMVKMRRRSTIGSFWTF